MDKYNEIKAVFEANADAGNAVKMSEYMRNQFAFYGIQSPRRKAVTKDFIKAAKKSKSIDWEFLDRCWEDDHRKCNIL